MSICRITGCEHRVKHIPNKSSAYSSWRIYNICPCCAIELFPKGYVPKYGISIKFHVSTNCQAFMLQEEKELEMIQRRKIVQ